MARRGEPTDLTDEAWRVVSPLLPAAKPGGRPRGVDPGASMNALRDLLRAGGAWRRRRHEFPPWPTGDAYLRRGGADGTWDRIAGGRRRDRRVTRGRAPAPSAASRDSQPVKPTANGGRGATTRASSPPAANATAWSTPRES